MKAAARYMWRYLTFAVWMEQYAALPPGEREGWPAWRRWVRPVGVSLFWAGVIFFVVTSNGAANTPARIAVFVAWVAAWSTCAAVGLLDWRRARKVSQQAQDRR